MNKKTLTYLIGGSLILSAAVIYRISDDNSSSTSRLKIEKNNEKVKQVDSRKFAPPVRGEVADTIDALARQIIAQSPNQEESVVFLAEAKSYRIEEMRSRRAKERADSAKANYDADFWQRKRGRIDADLAKEQESESIDTQAGTQNRYQGNGNTYSRQKSDLPIVRSEGVLLELFTLRAILKEGNTYVARLSYGDKRVPAKEGYTLFGKVKVDSVSRSEIVLSKGDESVTLYAY
ncbi:hypothetical protein [Pseudoalteromonas sp. GutCa3]|uniref:hypothetical protein n=1 Tax=Pseudoalteromonas sp. GutCa3 TaxID=888433 RepID=UPI000C324D59|nr:hypothetical protein [Pseudoalteromonas sp. GutCa3]PKG68618.1 hypothetical protein CXF64_20055 [Pseudoalteromonas sp. GutCa3]